MKTKNQILIVISHDDHLEVFGDKETAVRIVRKPKASSNDAEIIAEDYIHQSLPRYWKETYVPGKLIASSTTRPLLTKNMRLAKQVEEEIKKLNQLKDKFSKKKLKKKTTLI